MKNDDYALAPLNDDKYSERGAAALKYRARDSSHRGRSSRNQLNEEDYYSDESRSFTDDNNREKSSGGYEIEQRRGSDNFSYNNGDIDNNSERDMGGKGERRCDACQAKLGRSEGYRISMLVTSQQQQQQQQGTASESRKTADLYKYLSGGAKAKSSSKKERDDEKVHSGRYSDSKVRGFDEAGESKKRVSSAGKEKSGKKGLNIDAHINRYYSELRKLAIDRDFSESNLEKFQKRLDNLKVLRKAGEKMDSELFEKFKTKLDTIKRHSVNKRESGASAKNGGSSSSRRSSSMSRHHQPSSSKSSERKQRTKETGESKSLGSSSSRRNLSRR